MNDLYTGLIRQVYYNDKYWGRYSSLNNLKIPSNYQCLKMQINRLNLVLHQKGTSSQIDKFLSQITPGLPEEESKSLDKNISENIYGRIIDILNTGLWSNEENVYANEAKKKILNPSYKKNQQAINNSTEQRLNELKRLLDIAIKDKKLSARIVQKLERQFQGGYIRKNLREGCFNYSALKAKWAEEIMVDMLQSSNPEWKALVTGKMYFEGKQLIEDGMVFNYDVLNQTFKRGKTASFTVTKFLKNGEKTENTIEIKSIGEFLNKISKLSGSYSISLSNNLYDVLKKGATLKAQTKSGQNIQEIINKNKKNEISLLEAQNWEDYYKLVTLYKESLITHVKFFKENQYSKDLEMLTNYTLSKNIAKTSLISNDIYFTRFGALTAAEWMKKTGYFLRFVDQVNQIDLNTLQEERQYYLYHI